MSLESVLAAGRRAAESRMTSRATVRRKGASVTDADGFEVAGWSSVHAELPFRLKPKGQRQVSIGGVEFSAATAEANLPWNTADLRDGDYIEITSGEWAGEVVRVIEAVKGDQQTARRVPVESVSRPSEWA